MRVLVRLACVKPAASVRSEPGSNSQVERWPSLPGNKSQMQTALNSGTHIEHLPQGLPTLRHMQDAQCFGAICTAACASLHHLHFQTARAALRHYRAVERHFDPLRTLTSGKKLIRPSATRCQPALSQKLLSFSPRYSLLIKNNLSLCMGNGTSSLF